MGAHVHVQGIEEVRRLISGPCDSKVWLIFLTAAARLQDLHLDVKTFDRWRPLQLQRTRPFTAPSVLPKTGTNSSDIPMDLHLSTEWPQASASLSLALSGDPAELEVAMDAAALQDHPVDANGDGLVDEEEFLAYLGANRTVRFGAEFVRVSGVKLHYKGQTKAYKGINGDYYRTQEVANGRAVYVKVNKPATAMWWTNNAGRLSWGRLLVPALRSTRL